MSNASAIDALGAHVEDQRERRLAVGTSFFEREAERIARLCHRMAERFARGGRLLTLGADPAARSDARHVAVEFVHPVIVGKRALPALAFTAEGGPVDAQLELLADAQDIVMAFGAEDDPATQRALELARERCALTISCVGGDADWSFRLPGEDASIDQELTETLYHVLWELVHVFFEHRGLLDGTHRAPRA